MRKMTIFKIVYVICLVALCWIPMNAQDVALRGDVNEDEVVNINDVTVLINYLLTDEPPMSCDVNLDGVMNINDVTVLINYLLTDEWPSIEPVTETITVNNVSFKMVAVKGGTFTMGATIEQITDAYNDEKPAHQVTVSGYCIGETEVTQALWVAVMGTNPSYYTGDFMSDLNRPVEQVSWNACQEFIVRLNEITGKNFRLPTEAEWEFAARGGNLSEGNKYAGGNTIGGVAWYAVNASTQTQPVATKAANELGLYDMSGNVLEWCQDWYNKSYYSNSPSVNPTGPESGSNRVIRGGCFLDNARSCRVSSRNNSSPSITYLGLGLRLAL